MYQHDIDINDIYAAVPHDCTTCEHGVRKGSLTANYYNYQHDITCIYDRSEGKPDRTCKEWDISMDAFCGAIKMIEKHREETLARLKKEYAKE